MFQGSYRVLRTAAVAVFQPHCRGSVTALFRSYHDGYTSRSSRRTAEDSTRRARHQATLATVWMIVNSLLSPLAGLLGRYRPSLGYLTTRPQSISPRTEMKLKNHVADRFFSKIKFPFSFPSVVDSYWSLSGALPIPSAAEHDLKLSSKCQVRLRVRFHRQISSRFIDLTPCLRPNSTLH
ncbi:hypothetical protein BV22DRAFT_826993 [Leucogyrophana mollusca]|uniref:Uncharacterized protein n=1 Tax=Leucogyrophana mollusca TaxID=85980 RepID=A0ACB8B3S1_9AGAM|nr:hypothetical protein BV22DRAFT_826993 [Leucogyrophana mollusca]